MMKYLKRMFQRKPKVLLLDNTYRLVPAFEWKGETYYMHEDPMNVLTGRGLTAMQFFEEVLMRCSLSYLKLHTEATDKILSNPKSINLQMLMKLNLNLKERIELLAALPEHVYKMASIVFFTKDESPFRYDESFNKKKIKAWKETPGMYDFFGGTPLKTLMPFLLLEEENSEKFLVVQQKINEMHLKTLSAVLSRPVSKSEA